ncbi:tryptophan synthase subunit alpha [Megasphaera sp. AM44-1BH]|uniref:tryptophan synthase subunit alpha n=1 Tax=Megasphaera sp. AM44-1BH TaxID=2292358 RepID=UPI000E4B51FA|nr:tryptophan synthase subunit alpha [Megasphaera sp. AM44-1BH]RHA14584.1 tryptophan synthase subunit alpha [Megasphaera sp. AM44-1BH]
MSKIGNAFKDGKAFIGFLTAGDPSLDKTYEYIMTMEKAGADLIEIGIPFSDPIAEGIVIQEADLRSLKAGTRIDDVFELVKKVRRETQIPLVFLTYLNPVFYYGPDRFFARCEETGMDGIIIPDMPYEERDECAAAAKAHGIDIISMIAPTSKDRIEKIAKAGEGFLYIVSSLGVTGTRTEIKTDLKEIIDVVKHVTDVPAAVGFGINTTEQAEKIGAVADGVIVGSAIVKIIAKYGDDAAPYIYDYVKSMKEATMRSVQ